MIEVYKAEPYDKAIIEAEKVKLAAMNEDISTKTEPNRVIIAEATAKKAEAEKINDSETVKKQSKIITDEQNKIKAIEENQKKTIADQDKVIDKNLKEANVYYDEALRILNQIFALNDKTAISPKHYLTFGEIYRLKRNFDKAIESYHRVLDLTLPNKNEWKLAGLTAHILNDLGSYYLDFYQTDEGKKKAMELYDKSMAVANAINDVELQILLLNNIAIAYEKQKDYFNAIAHHEESLSKIENSHNKYRLAKKLIDIAYVYQQKFENDLDPASIEKALYYVERALAIESPQDLDHPDYADDSKYFGNLKQFQLYLSYLRSGERAKQE